MNILLVDSYDSYTYNLYQLLLDVVPDANIIIVRNDRYTANQLADIVSRFDLIVIGPGPGNPLNASDIGFLNALFEFKVPILGICLGFQVLCMHFGGKVERLTAAKHGQISPLILKPGSNLFAGASEPAPVTRYHSLCASAPPGSDLEDIAWADDVENGRVVMAARHTTLPFAGVQFHPESICSSNGPLLVRNFVAEATHWNLKNKRSIKALGDMTSVSIVPRPLLSVQPAAIGYKVLFQTLPFALPASRIAELLGIYKAKHLIMLDSAAAPSRYSILSATPEENVSLTYRNGDDFYVLQGQQIKLNGMSIWEAIAAIMQEYKCSVGPAGSPFWGGLSGYISYEAGLTTLDVPVAPSPTKTPDINLVLVKRSVVVDYKDKVMYLQSLVLFSQASDNWLQTCAEAIQHGAVQDCRLVNGGHAAGKIRVKLPMKENYIQSIRRCQELLAEGQSYELCLTDLTRIDCGTKREAWELYQTLRLRNPSPFACFMALPGVDLLSSSPERFLSWTRDGLCELRPIKGTIRKQPGSSLEEAKRELNNPKDYAENLMIVDLIRHDLHQIAKRVSVPSLMQVEEYETVYQLVSVIQGYVGDSVSAPGQQAFSGFDVLAHALPPGSMTGAPKKRSVELLQTIEGHNRGIYSGVCGYLSVCGAGDWSVIIRSAFRHSDEAARSGTADTWWIGAGGAITTLSDPEAEWEEMLTKLQSTLPGFGSDVDFIS